MEVGRFGSETSLQPPEDGGERDSQKKKKKKHAGEARPDESRRDEQGKGHETEKHKRPAPDTLAPLLERITSELKPDERKAAEADKKPEEKPERHEEARDAVEAAKDREDESADLGTLSAEERREAAKIYLDEREKRVASERESTAPETTAASITEAVDEFIAHTREKLTAGSEADVDEAVEESFDEVVREFAPDIHPEGGTAEDQAAISELEIIPGVDAGAPTVELERIPSVDESDAANAMAYEDMAPHVPEANPLPDEGVTAPYELPFTEGTEEHEPPVEPVAYAYDFQPPQAQYHYNQPPVSPIAAAGAELASSTERASVPVAVPLIVGFAAYLFGKRRGRIKAEQRLVPIQKKLEREVRTIHEKLAAKETELRKLVRKQADIRPAAERPSPGYGSELAAVAAGTVVGAEAAREYTVHAAPVQARYETAQDNRPSVAAETVVQREAPNIRTPEQIAAMPLTDVPEQEPPFMPIRASEVTPRTAPPAETRGQLSGVADKAPFETSRRDIFDTPEVSPLPGITPAKQEIPVSSMTREEVVRAADEIIVGTATVRQVFETGLISERGMRRIVGEAKRNGDVRAVLAEEMMIKETGYERDPQLRDQPVRHSPAAASVQPPVQQAVAPSAAQSHEENALPVPSSAMHPAPPPRPARPRMSPVAQSALLAANIIALVVLGILLLILFVMHL